MTTRMKKAILKVYSLFGGVRVGGLIRVDENGFWRVRSSPSKSLKEAARLFNQLSGETIIEIGTGLHGRMAGNSILVWLRKTSAKKIVAIDLDPQRIHEVQGATARCPNVQAIVGDGIEYLRQFPGKIDLLYLDFWTPDPPGTVAGTGRAEAYREAYWAAKDKMSARSIILVDDTDHIPPYKHTYIVPEARKDGYVVLYTGRQTLLRR